MSFFIVPIEQVGYMRAPRYVESRINPGGLIGAWSFKDFGTQALLGLLHTDIPLNQPDVFRIPEIGQWSVKERNDLQSALRDGGIEDRGWIASAAHWREGLHRLAGLSQAMQASFDDPHKPEGAEDPSRWLAKEVRFGDYKLDAFDQAGFARAQGALAEARRLLMGDWELIGKEWVNLKTGQRIPAIMGSALPVTDDFTTGTNQALTAYSANWSNNIGAFAVIAASDSINPNNGGNECGAFHNVETFNNDQYGQLQITSRAAGSAIGAGCRHGAASVATYYGWYSSSTASYLFKSVTGTWTQLGSTGSAGAVNDVFRIEAEGTTIRPKINGSVPGTPGAQTDSSITSGKGGISGFNNSTSMLGDNFEAGNLSGAAATILRQMMAHEGA